MRIARAETAPVDLPLREGYRIAGRTIAFVRNFLLRLETDGRPTGHGGAAPAEEVTGESDEACLAALRGPLRDLALGSDPLERDALMARAGDAAPGCPAARAALDIALWDIAGQAAGQPLLRLWGGRWRPLPTSTTIGVCGVRETLEAAQRWVVEQRFRALKIKVGEDAAADVERVRALRETFGAGVALRADANQGYTLDQARSFLRGVAGCDLEHLEQPLPASDLEGMRALRLESRIPILADESARSEAEAAEVIARGAASGINVKLMKCGGPTAARAIHERARAADLPLMFGCNDETRVSMTAAAHLALALPGFRWADLDGHLDLASDPASGGIEIRDGMLLVGDLPGLGVDVRL